MALHVVLHHRQDADQPWVNAWLDDDLIEAIQTTTEIGHLCRRAKERGERVSPELCAACRRPIGSAAALSLIDGNRVHDRPDNDCLIRHGNRWRGAATRALTDMGLHRPMAV